MHFTRILRVLAALAMAVSSTTVVAHNDVSQFNAAEWQCFGMPQILRKTATNQQYFLLSNTGSEDLQYFIGATDYLGRLSSNLVRSVTGGLIRPGKTVSLTNTQLQRTDVPPNQEEGGYVCFAVNHGPIIGGVAGPFKPSGAVSVRELRRVSDQWVSFDLPATGSSWLVSARQSTRASATGNLQMQMHQAVQLGAQ